MSQNSILELLSVTSNAVKALDKTNSSKSSGSGGGTPRAGGREDDAENQPPAGHEQDPHSNSKSSADSGVGKTVTKSNQAVGRTESPMVMHDSDDSTTASDVLIRSTLVEGDPSHNPATVDTSAASQGSRCRELDNFNVAEAKQVKVSKKHLQEIISARDSFHGNERPEQNFTDALSHQNPNSMANLNTNNNRAAGKQREKHENGKVINGFSGNVPSIPAKHSSSDGNSKNFPGQRKKLNQGLDNSASKYTVERHGGDKKQVSTKEFPPDAELQDGNKPGNMKPSSGSGQFPYKVSRHDGSTKEQLYVEQQALAEDWEGEFSFLLFYFLVSFSE